MSRSEYITAITLWLAGPFVLAPLLIASAGSSSTPFALGLAAAVLMTIAWYVVSPSWLAIGMRARPIAAALMALEIAAIAWLRTSWDSSSSHAGWTAAVAAAAFLWLSCTALAGMRRPQGVLNLRSPFTQGLYACAHGGNVASLNNHYRHEHQRYAIDVVRLTGPLLSKCRRLASQRCEDYAIFGTEICSPCSGKVTAIRDGLDDMRPGTTDRANAYGNHVVLEHENGTLVVLCHLKKGSISVRPAQLVSAGELIARVGNSGNSTEPHLHLHAEQSGRSVPFVINGRWLFRNRLFEGTVP